MKAFPHEISARQFRFAFKTLLRITSPPAPLSFSHSHLAETLLELLYHRASLRASQGHATLSNPNKSRSTALQGIAPEQEQSDTGSVDERSSLVLALLDSLPFISLYLLEEWLPIASDLIHMVDDPRSREQCRQRFWEVLSSSEMDVERSQTCVTWWHTKGGQQRVMQGDPEQYFMSGALRGDVMESKL